MWTSRRLPFRGNEKSMQSSSAASRVPSSAPFDRTSACHCSPDKEATLTVTLRKLFQMAALISPTNTTILYLNDPIRLSNEEDGMEHVQQLITSFPDAYPDRRRRREPPKPKRFDRRDRHSRRIKTNGE